MEDHKKWMRIALQEAKKAFKKLEVPVGAVIVHEGEIIGKGYNLVETLHDPTAHAEMMAISAASRSLASWRLDDSILYTTLEPCSMCTGAILLSRISTVVYGAPDPRYGACGSVLQIADNENLDIKVKVIGGILKDECSTILKDFFSQIRQKNEKLFD
ncbi:nucleoside deaminase [candidate division KSB1 bacterium]|nr:nucleoside deaminase [candidate division KSB1 bacterium]